MSSVSMETRQAELEPALQQIVQEQMDHWTVPGMTVGVLQDGEQHCQGFGIASIATGQPVTPETLFQIGSITKVFTATLIMMLVDEGRLDLDTPAAQYLPNLRLQDAEAQRRITLRHLLSHTSGLYGDRFDNYGPGDDALRKAIDEFDKLRQLTAPGELWAYCNTGFQLLGAVIEQMLDQGIEQALRERVLEPLGLRHSVFFAHEAITYAAAVGHNKLPEKDLVIARPYRLPRCMNAAGAIIGTAGDLLRFAAFHMGDGTADGKRLLSEASLRAMQTPQVEAGSFADHYGLGWALRQLGGLPVVGHGGSTNGFRAQLTLVPERRFAIALLTNGSRGAAANAAVERWALTNDAGLKLTEPKPAQLSQDALERFAGRYVQPLSTATITVQGGGLRIEVLQKSPLNGEEVVLPPETAVPIGAARFRIVDGEAEGSTVDFIAGPGSRPRFIRLHGRLAEPEEAEAASE